MTRYLIFMLFIIAGMETSAQTVSITGTTWTVASPTAPVTLSGKNYESNETSAANQTLISMTGLVLTGISVRQIVGANWDAGLEIWVKRTGNGAGLTIPLGGDNFQKVTTTNTAFFSVLLTVLSSSKSGIPVQYEIRGLSVLLPVKTYTTTIQYTVAGL